MNCPLCLYQKCNSFPSFAPNCTAFECKNCGKFTLTAQAASAIGENGWKLAAYVLEQNRIGNTPIFYSSQKSLSEPRQLTGQSFQANAPTGSVGVDAALETFPKAVPERLDRALINLAANSKHLGQDIRVGNYGINPMLLAQNTAETFFVIRQFASAGFITGEVNMLPTAVVLTAKGMNRVTDLQRGLFGPLNKQAFVAMSFNPDLNNIWTDGLKLGIEDCGYTAMRVDVKEHNEDICDVIIAEIRKSKFIVADFTEQKHGVYFEAGMMMGLGRPVIFTCRKDEIETAHFDTNHYNHITWETPAELREKLKRRIQATIAS